MAYPLLVLLVVGLAACGGTDSSPSATTQEASALTEQGAASGEVDRTVPLEPKGNQMKFAQVTFTAPEEEGDYRYICTFPGHWATMQGPMTVEKGAAEPFRRTIASVGNLPAYLPDPPHRAGLHPPAGR